MIKTFHEAPKSMFHQMQEWTRGDYALANLCDDAEYFELFRDAVRRGREVILDNGVFELGKAFEANVFADWVEKLRPAYYIVPDVLEDCDATCESFEKFITGCRGLPGQVMGVAQGKNYEDFIRCYRFLEPYCDKIGISFDCSWYGSSWAQMALGRQKLLQRMDDEWIINRDKPHHLLGVALPQDMKFYRAMQTLGQMLWIDSVDTSNPVVHGLFNKTYAPDEGLTDKESTKLYTLINAVPTPQQRKFIKYNVHEFWRYANG